MATPYETRVLATLGRIELLKKTEAGARSVTTIVDRETNPSREITLSELPMGFKQLILSIYGLESKSPEMASAISGDKEDKSKPKAAPANRPKPVIALRVDLVLPDGVKVPMAQAMADKAGAIVIPLDYCADTMAITIEIIDGDGQYSLYGV